ncbi:MAG: hypothetical protein P1U88_10240 [Thalassobaculaceae bacterium]|nr:hypothetical protein [Thalassobaculaceae bacterium]
MRKLAVIAAFFTFAIAMPAAAEDLEFLLINDSSADLVGFYVSPASSEHWEENLLDGGSYLAPGYEVTVSIADGLTTCIYDIRGVFSDGDVVDDHSLDLCELGEYTFTE